MLPHSPNVISLCAFWIEQPLLLNVTLLECFCASKYLRQFLVIEYFLLTDPYLLLTRNYVVQTQSNAYTLDGFMLNWLNPKISV